MNILYQRTLDAALEQLGFPSTDIEQSIISELIILDNEYLLTFHGGWGHVTDDFGIINKVQRRQKVQINEHWHYKDMSKRPGGTDWNAISTHFLDQWYSEQTHVQVLGFEDMPFRILVSNEKWLPILHKSSGCSKHEAEKATQLMRIYEVTWNAGLGKIADLVQGLEQGNRE